MILGVILFVPRVIIALACVVIIAGAALPLAMLGRSDDEQP